MQWSTIFEHSIFGFSSSQLQQFGCYFAVEMVANDYLAIDNSLKKTIKISNNFQRIWTNDSCWVQDQTLYNFRGILHLLLIIWKLMASSNQPNIVSFIIIVVLVKQLHIKGCHITSKTNMRPKSMSCLFPHPWPNLSIFKYQSWRKFVGCPKISSWRL